MNSISNVKRAIESEVERQTEMLNKGEIIVSETRGFNALKGNTFSMRSKEAANDYRYFPEPDLPPFIISDAYLNEVKAALPALPEQLYNQLKNEMGLSEYDTKTITEDKATAFFYLSICEHSQNYKAIANWVLGPVKSYLNDTATDIEEFKLPVATIAELIQLIEDGKLSHSAAAQTVFPALMEAPEKSAILVAESLNVIQTSDLSFISDIVKDVLSKFPDKVEEYKAGKKGITSGRDSQIH
jgi:aspartyl-tRNA(Asn)/glutamyl-tRNA(Gln) amidotransferase subunit B